MNIKQNDLKLFELDKKRRNLNTLIGEWIDRNKKPKEIQSKVKVYEDVTNKMIKMGAKVSIRSPHLKTEYWDNHTVEDFKKSKSKSYNSSKNIKTVEKVTIKEVYIEPKKSYYILNIAWTETNDNTLKDKFLSKIKPYLEFVGLSEMDENTNDFDTHIEYIVKYKYYGFDGDFELLKQTLSYIISINEMGDMGVFGKKRK